MKNAWRAKALGAILSALVITGCSSTQPDSFEDLSGSLSFTTSASVTLWACYESPFLYCFPETFGLPPVQRVVDRLNVPWRYSIEVTIIRAGTVYPVLAVSTTGVPGTSIYPGDGVDDFVSLTDYDLADSPAPDRTEFGVDFTSGKIVTAAHPLYLQWIFVDPGVPNILAIVSATPGTPATFDFELNRGDTVVVRARKQQTSAAPGFSPPFQNVKLSARLDVSETPVSVQGSATSSTEDKAGFTFSYTVQ